MQNNHSKNGTILGIYPTCPGGTVTAVRVGRDRVVCYDVHLDHGRAGIQVPDELVRTALHGRLAQGEKAIDGTRGRL